jgi:hypothetical protein
MKQNHYKIGQDWGGGHLFMLTLGVATKLMDLDE